MIKYVVEHEILGTMTNYINLIATQKLSNLMTIHVNKSVTSHEVSNIYF